MITSSSHYKAAVAAPRNATVFPWPTSGFTAAEAVMGEGTKQTTLTRRQKTPGNRLPGKCTINIQFLSMIFPTCRGSIASSSAMSLCSSGQAKQFGTTQDVSSIVLDTFCRVPWGAQNFAGNSMPQWCWLQSYPAFIEDQNEGPPSCLIDFPTMGYHNSQ
jgi:hypothetical protein